MRPVTNTLESIDQTPRQHYEVLENTRESSHPHFFSSAAKQQAAAATYGTLQLLENSFTPNDLRSLQSGPPRELSLDAHLGGSCKPGTIWHRSTNHSEEKTRHHAALRWLSKNKQRYAGQWVALRGDCLLAAGENAKDVFAPFRGQQPPALVVHVEAEELPFGGW